MENFLLAVEAVAPLFCLMFIGLCVKRGRLLTDAELVHVNRLVFTVFFAIMMFYNLYITDIGTVMRPRLMLFAVGALAVIYLVSFFLICRTVQSNRSRGAMIQAIYRSNFVLMGIPLAANICGEAEVAVTTMMIAIVVPIYNILGVFTLETFRGGRFAFWPILRGVLKNPMILGALLGAFCMLIGLPIPKAVLKPLAQVTAAATPLALIVLGASFHFGRSLIRWRPLAACVAGRLVLVPGIVLFTAMALGFRGIEFVTLISIFATPSAVASFAMAQQMDSDAGLAGNCVVYSSALSCITIFGWVFLFKVLGLY